MKESVIEEFEFTLLAKVDVVTDDVTLGSAVFFPGYDSTTNSYGATTEDGSAVNFMVDSDVVTVSGLQEGLHTITVTETATVGGAVESYVFVLGYDKSPTVAMAIEPILALSTDAEYHP